MALPLGWSFNLLLFLPLASLLTSCPHSAGHAHSPPFLLQETPYSFPWWPQPQQGVQTCCPEHFERSLCHLCSHFDFNIILS